MRILPFKICKRERERMEWKKLHGSSKLVHEHEHEHKQNLHLKGVYQI